MNGVEALDQFCTSITTAWMEQRVPMFISTFLLGTSIQNRYDLYLTVPLI